MTALVVCAHGTDNPRGQQVVRSIVRQVALARPDLTVAEAYVDVQQPTLPDVVDDLVAQHESVTVVPLLLSSGFHTEVDVADAVAPHPGARAARALGPHPLLAQVLFDRLLDAGADRQDPVVLAVAGSSRAAGAADAEAMRAQLDARWTGPVTLGYLAAREPSVSKAVSDAGSEAVSRAESMAASGGGSEAVAGAAPSARVAVASYLIGPGFFQDQLGRVGAGVVAAPLGDDPRLAELVVRRFEAVDS